MFTDKERKSGKLPDGYMTAFAFVEENKIIPQRFGAYLLGMAAAESFKDKMGLEGYNKACNGDFSMFETVDPTLRNFLASQYEHNADLWPNPDLKTNLEQGHVGPAERQFLEENKKNPAFRLYCSLKSRENEYFRSHDDLMVDMIMEDTMRPMTADQIDKVHEMVKNPEDAQKMIETNVEKQVQMAKMMFLTHFGKTKLVNDANEKVDMDRSVASMMAHCSRTAFVFPKGEQKEVDKMMVDLVGAKKGKAAGIYGRLVATHDVKQGEEISEFKELKNPSFKHQYGMDVAIGGLGNPGIKGANGVPQTLKTDGTCGHMYMRVDKGGPEQTSSLLVGFESDAPGKNNQQGHGHTGAAKGEFMSSFLGQREDEMGAKYGGRIVDCTMFRPGDLSLALEDFTNHYRAMVYEAMKNPEKRNQLEVANSMLSGKLMNPQQLETCLNLTGVKLDMAKAHTAISAEKKHVEFDHTAKASGVPEVKPMEAPEKPGKRVRFKAFFGNAAAKKMVEKYNAVQAAKKEATKKTPPKKVAMSFNEFSKEAAKDSPAKKKVAMKKTPENVLANEAAKKAKGRTGMK